jgi:hypothetical protein
MAPWTTSTGPGQPIWNAYPKAKAERIREAYEERAAIMEYHGNVARHWAEICAYAFLVDALWDASAIPARAIVPFDVVRQLDVAIRIRRNEWRKLGCRIIWGLCQFALTPLEGHHRKQKTRPAVGMRDG